MSVEGEGWGKRGKGRANLKTARKKPRAVKGGARWSGDLKGNRSVGTLNVSLLWGKRRTKEKRRTGISAIWIKTKGLRSKTPQGGEEDRKD